jgi:two-component system cell cycle sensor histidine kinase PleC
MMRSEVLGELPNEAYRAYVADIHNRGAHLLGVIDDILDLSKAEAEKPDLHDHGIAWRHP